SKVPFGTYAVSFEHPEYAFTQQIVTAAYGNEPYVSGRMISRGPTRTFNADQVTEISQGPLTLIFEPGDLTLNETGTPVHGDVNIRMTAVEPDKPGHILAAPRLEGI